MADIYVRSTDGLDTDSGATWALAKAKLAGADAIDAAGDNTYVSPVHAETTAGAITLTMAGTVTNPSKIVCVSDTTEPPPATATGASVTMTGAGAFNIRGSGYVQGIAFNAGSAAASFVQLMLNSAGNAGPNAQHYENCDFNVVDTHPSSFLQLGSQNASDAVRTKLTNCRFKMGNANQYISLYSTLHITGGSFIAGGATPNVPALFQLGTGSKDTNVLIENFDFSNLSSALVLFWAPTNGRGGVAILRNCKLPAGWAGSLVSGAINYPNWRVEMHNCDAGATNYKSWIETCEGTIRQEVVIVKTGGASDGTTPKSLKMTASANANELTGALASPIISDWADTVGTSRTVTVDILHDSATPLTDAEVWLEVDYLGSSATPLGTKATGKRATILTTPSSSNAFISASTATWTTTGLTTPNKQKLTLAYTPQMKGEYLTRVVNAKSGKTIYVDQLPQVS